MARPRKPIDFHAVRVAIGERIRSAREALGLNQTDLARQIGYTAANPVSKLENGQMAALDIGRLAAIARACDVDLEWLMEPAAKAARVRSRS